MKWIIQPNAPESFLNEHPELSPIIAKLLWDRGLRSQIEIDEFLNPDYSQDIHDPFLFLLLFPYQKIKMRHECLANKNYIKILNFKYMNF